MGRLFRAMGLLEIVDDQRTDGNWEVKLHGDIIGSTFLVDPQVFQARNIEVPEIFQSLTPDQIEKLIHHAWELEGHRFTVASTQFIPVTPTTTTGGTA